MRHFSLLAIALCLIAVPSSAQIVNGTFDDGLVGWTLVGPNSIRVFADTTHGNPGACCGFGVSCHFSSLHEGIAQSIECGGDTGQEYCVIDFDYRFSWSNVSQFCHSSATLKVFVDDELVWHESFSGDQNWKRAELTVASGPHALRIYGDGSDETLVYLDNIRATASSVAVEGTTWSRIKTDLFAPRFPSGWTRHVSIPPTN